jgi:2-keto-4-pentenoate hydratase
LFRGWQLRPEAQRRENPGVHVDQIAQELLEARRAGRTMAPPSGTSPEFSMNDGYAVGRRIHDDAVASGATPAGYKLGFTNTSVWAAAGLDRPFWARIYDTTVRTDTRVSLDGLVAPRLEPEIVLGIGVDLAPGATDVAGAVEWAALGFEVVQCRYPDWRLLPPDAVADAGLHGFLVVGDRVPLGPNDGEALAAVDVELQRRDETVGKGSGSLALGGPVEALRWLLRLDGVEGLRAGDVVTTGSLTNAMPLATGERWSLHASGPVALTSLTIDVR